MSYLIQFKQQTTLNCFCATQEYSRRRGVKVHIRAASYVVSVSATPLSVYKLN